MFLIYSAGWAFLWPFSTQGFLPLLSCTKARQDARFTPVFSLCFLRYNSIEYSPGKFRFLLCLPLSSAAVPRMLLPQYLLLPGDKDGFPPFWVGKKTNQPKSTSANTHTALTLWLPVATRAVSPELVCPACRLSQALQYWCRQLLGRGNAIQGPEPSCGLSKDTLSLGPWEIKALNTQHGESNSSLEQRRCWLLMGEGWGTALLL